jgi:hypothetical protein
LKDSQYHLQLVIPVQLDFIVQAGITHCLYFVDTEHIVQWDPQILKRVQALVYIVNQGHQHKDNAQRGIIVRVPFQNNRVLRELIIDLQETQVLLRVCHAPKDHIVLKPL